MLVQLSQCSVSLANFEPYLETSLLYHPVVSTASALLLSEV